MILFKNNYLLTVFWTWSHLRVVLLYLADLANLTRAQEESAAYVHGRAGSCLYRCGRVESAATGYPGSVNRITWKA